MFIKPHHRPQVGDVINMDPMEALNEDYENFELEYFMPRWEKVVDEGGLRMWATKVLSSSDNAYKNLTHFVFKNPTGAPIKFGTNSFLDSKLQEMGTNSRKCSMGQPLKLYILRIKFNMKLALLSGGFLFNAYSFNRD